MKSKCHYKTVKYIRKERKIPTTQQRCIIIHETDGYLYGREIFYNVICSFSYLSFPLLSVQNIYLLILALKELLLKMMNIRDMFVFVTTYNITVYKYIVAKNITLWKAAFIRNNLNWREKRQDKKLHFSKFERKPVYILSFKMSHSNQHLIFDILIQTWVKHVVDFVKWKIIERHHSWTKSIFMLLNSKQQTIYKWLTSHLFIIGFFTIHTFAHLHTHLDAISIRSMW